MAAAASACTSATASPYSLNLGPAMALTSCPAAWPNATASCPGRSQGDDKNERTVWRKTGEGGKGDSGRLTAVFEVEKGSDAPWARQPSPRGSSPCRPAWRSALQWSQTSTSRHRTKKSTSRGGQERPQVKATKTKHDTYRGSAACRLLSWPGRRWACGSCRPARRGRRARSPRPSSCRRG